MNIYLIIVGMMVVTYIPRLLPFFALDQEKIPPGVKRWLKWLPYAALGALIIPGGLQAIKGPLWVSALALMITASLSWFHKNIIVAVLLTLLLLYILPLPT